MKRIYVLLAMVALVSGWRLSDLAWDEWQTFKLEHKKHYHSAEEEQLRMNIYLRKRHMIAKHNGRFHRGQESFSLKTNQFSDMTHQKYLKIAKGFKSKSRRTSKNPSTMFSSPANVRINDSVDWRQVGAVSRVQDQLECNSCWAFSAVLWKGSYSARTRSKFRSQFNTSLIVQRITMRVRMLDGNMEVAFEYIEENKGIEIEKYYPYEAKNDTCRYNPKYSGRYDVGFQDLPESDEEKLKEAVATIGPISAAVDASLNSFSTCSDEVYYDNRCTDNLNHAVLVVGYGTDERKGDYWILKNMYIWNQMGRRRIHAFGS